MCGLPQVKMKCPESEKCFGVLTGSLVQLNEDVATQIQGGPIFKGMV